VSARIKTLPTRHPELGRLRAGYQDADGKMQPLREWRMTSKSEAAIKQAADLYGGTPQVWAERPDEWEVFTNSASLDCMLPLDPLFTAYEKWGSGGNQRRCDGETCIVPIQDPEGGHLEEVPCWCDQNSVIPSVDKKACDVTVRLKVVLPQIQGLGIWMFTSGSIYAAIQLPAQVDTIESIRSAGLDLMPCNLVLDYRTEKRAYEKFERRYSVPMLSIDDSIAGIMAQLEGGRRRRSVAPALPGESAAPTAALAPPAPAGLAPAPGEPTDGSGEQLPIPKGSRSWTQTVIRELCQKYEVPMGSSMLESMKHLEDAGIIA
jgi:hypothetical protein